MDTDENKGILSVPYELQVQIKKYLNNEEYKNYDLTCRLVNQYIPLNNELSVRMCGMYEYTYFDVNNKEWYKCYHLPCIKYIIQRWKKRIEYDYYFFNTLLRKSSNNGQLNIVRYLFEEIGMDLSYIRGCFELVFNDTVINGHLNIIRYFVEEIGVTIEDIRKEGRDYGENKVLKLASVSGHLHIVKYLFESVGLTESDIYNNEECNCAITLASMEGHLDIVKYYFEEINFDVHKLGPGMSDPFISALEYDRIQVVKYYTEMFEKNSIDITSYMRSFCPHILLMHLIDCESLLSINYFIEKFIFDKHMTNLEYSNIAYKSVKKGYLNVIKYLIEVIGIKFTSETSVIRFIIKIGKLDILKYFIEDLKVDMGNEKMNMIKCAILCNRASIIEYFLDNKDLNISPKDIIYVNEKIIDSILDNSNDISYIATIGQFDELKFFVDRIDYTSKEI